MYVIFSKSNKLVSVLIRLLSRSKYSHVGIYDHNNEVVIHASGPLGGVVETPILDFLEGCNYNAELAMLPGNIEVARDLVGQDYDYAPLLGILLGISLDDPDKWNCTELVAEAMGVYRPGTPSRLKVKHLWWLSKPIARIRKK